MTIKSYLVRYNIVYFYSRLVIRKLLVTENFEDLRSPLSRFPNFKVLNVVELVSLAFVYLLASLPSIDSW